MKPKLSVREREKQRQVLMRGVAAVDDRLRMADAACVELERQVKFWRRLALAFAVLILADGALRLTLFLLTRAA